MSDALPDSHNPAQEVIAALSVDRSRLGRRSKRKGKVFERLVAEQLRPIFGPQVKRTIQSRSGRDGCDVECTPFWIEAKHRKLVNLRAALRQGLNDTDGRPVVVVARDNGCAPVVLMQLSDWLALVGPRE